MKRLTIPSGRECDALPSGEYACWLADGSAVQTHVGLVPTVKGIVPRFVRVTKVGGFQFAGQADHYGPDEGPCVTWHETTGWAFLATVPCGTSPVIYDRNGNLHISNCGPGIGSQGFRYVDYVTGRIVPGDETIASPVGLSEWIDLGDGILVGLGNVVNGCTIWDGHDLRMLEPGDNQFIRAQRDGDQVSLAMARYHGEPSVIIWTTMAELRGLPIVTVPPPTREPIVKIGRPILLGWFVFQQ